MWTTHRTRLREHKDGSTQDCTDLKAPPPTEQSSPLLPVNVKFPAKSKYSPAHFGLSSYSPHPSSHPAQHHHPNSSHTGRAAPPFPVQPVTCPSPTASSPRPPPCPSPWDLICGARAHTPTPTPSSIHTHAHTPAGPRRLLPVPHPATSLPALLHWVRFSLGWNLQPHSQSHLPAAPAGPRRLLPVQAAAALVHQEAPSHELTQPVDGGAPHAAALRVWEGRSAELGNDCGQ